MLRTGNRAVVCALLTGLGIAFGGCDGLGNGPSDIAPVSRLWYDKAPDAQSGFQAARLATSNATFGARVFTSCDPGPVGNGPCPSLMVWAVPHAGTSWCQLILYAPEGEPLRERAYPSAERFPAAGVAGLAFSCGRAACDALEGQFTIHRLVAEADVVTLLHATFEQTCRLDGQPLGRLSGEVWIVDGMRGSPPGFPGP